MPLSATQLCNMALPRIGEMRITNFATDKGEQAIVCRDVFQPTLDEVISRWNWNIAKQRKLVAVSADAPAFGYDYQYDYPSDPWCLRPLKVSVGGTPLTKWVSESRKILTSEEDAEIQLLYLRRITNPGELPVHISRLFWHRLAHVISLRRSGSRTLSEELFNEIENKIFPEALAIEAKEGYADEDGEDEWINTGR